jgi:hypothetical protein
LNSKAIALALLLVISTFVVPLQSAFAVDTSNYPTASSTIAKSSITWQNPDNILANDGNYAYAPLAGREISDYLLAHNFGFSGIVGNLQKVEVEIERASTDNNMKDYGVYLSTSDCTSELSGTNAAKSPNFGGGSWVVANYGTGAGSDFTGTAGASGWNMPTLTIAQIEQADFAVCYAATNTGASGSAIQAQVDYIKVTVYTDATDGSVSSTVVRSATAGSDLGSSWQGPTNIYTDDTNYAVVNSAITTSSLTDDPSTNGAYQGSGLTNPTNAYLDDGVYANTTVTVAGGVQSTDYSGFDFSAIPNTATIKKVEVIYQYQVNSTSGDPYVQMTVTPDGGSRSSVYSYLADQNTVKVDYLNTTDVTSVTSWTPAKLGAGFKVSLGALRQTASGSQVTSAIAYDYLNVKVTYAVAGAYDPIGSGNKTSYLKASGFFDGTVIPDDATITGLQVNITKQAVTSTGSIFWKLSDVYLTYDGSNTPAYQNQGTQTAVTTADAILEFGNNTSTWGTGTGGANGATQSNIDNSNFAILIKSQYACTSSSIDCNLVNTNTLSIDYVSARAYYTLAPYEKFPTDGDSIASGSAAFTDWSNSGNIFTANKVNATVTLGPGAQSYTLIGNDFDFDIPDDHIINEVNVTFAKFATGTGSIKDLKVEISKDLCTTPSSTNQESNTAWSDSIAKYAPGDNWGLALSVADVESPNFSVCIDVENTSNSATATAEIDYVLVTITSTPPPAAPILYAKATTNNDVDLTWYLSPSDRTGVDHWDIFRCDDENMAINCTTININDGPGTADSYTDNDAALVNGQTYYYQITAIDNGASSARSNVASVEVGTIPASCPADYTDCLPETAPNGGTVLMSTPVGDIQYLTSVSSATIQGQINENLPGRLYDWEWLDFKLTGVNETSVTLTLEFSEPIRARSHFYKTVSGNVYDITSQITSNDGDNIVYLTIEDDNPQQDANPITGIIEDPIGIGFPAGNSACTGECYPPHLGVDYTGKSFYDDGLTINDQTYKVDNVLHNSPDAIINLPVGEPVFIKIKAQDQWASQINHCELGVAIPHGVFDKSQSAFQINVDRDYDGKVTKYVTGDTTALNSLSVSFENTGDLTAECRISFVPTKHLQNDMFSIEVWDIYHHSGTYYFNHGIEFKGVSLVGTPIYQVMDDRGKPATISIIDQTLEDMTKAIDTSGNTWTLVDGFWNKDYIPNDLSCDPNEGRSCIMFHDKVMEQRELAKKYFDSSLLQKESPKSFSKDIKYSGDRVRGPHEPSQEMKTAIEIAKSSRPLK